MRNILLLMLLAAILNPGEPRFPRAISDRELDGFLEGIMHLIVADDSKRLFDSLVAVSALDPGDFRGYCANIMALRMAATERLGGGRGWSVISVQRVGQNLRRYIYIDKMRYGAILWTFCFYNGGDGWRLTSISSDDATKIWSMGVPIAEGVDREALRSEDVNP